MDVSCPKCRTEYELDDARVKEDGVTVKCTSCAHVFRVKKKEMILTLPVRPEDERGATNVTDLPPPSPAREWKVRQPNGNLFACRELTTLQTWIVEGKVSRDDEISLTGETWKRLGNIPELASFFQVVDEASRARALDALQHTSSSRLEPLGGAPPAPTQPASQKIYDTWREPQFSTQLPTTLPGQPPPPPPPSVPSGQSAKDLHPAFTPARETFPPAATRRERPAYQPGSDEETDAEDLVAVKGSRRGVWALVLIGLGIGAAAGYYFGVYQPEQERLAEKEASDKRAEEARKEAERKAEEKRRAELAALDAGPDGGADAGIDGGADAGRPDAGPPDAGKAGGGEARSFDSYLEQAESLRERDKPEAALSMYGRAADLRPERVEPMAGRGLALLDLGQALAAQASFEQALKTNEKYGPAIMGLAEAFRAQGKNDRAVEYYQRYIDVLPEGSEAEVARKAIEKLKAK